MLDEVHEHVVAERLGCREERPTAVDLGQLLDERGERARRVEHERVDPDLLASAATHLEQRGVERMTELNRGRAFFTTPQTLGDFVLVDFIEQKREMLRGRRAG